MRILFATDYYPPYIGGAQIQTALLARSFQERGHEVVVVTAWQNDLPAFEEREGIPVYRLRQLRTLPGHRTQALAAPPAPVRRPCDGSFAAPCDQSLQAGHRALVWLVQLFRRGCVARNERPDAHHRPRLRV